VIAKEGMRHDSYGEQSCSGDTKLKQAENKAFSRVFGKHIFSLIP